MWQGLDLPESDQALIVFRDHVNNLYFIREFKELKEKGLYVELGAYKFQVYLDFQVVFDSPRKPYRTLCQQLNGRGVADLEMALKEILYRPLHQILKQALEDFFVPKFKVAFEKSESPAAFKKTVEKAWAQPAGAIARFEGRKADSGPIKQIANYVQRYFLIAETDYFEQSVFDLSGKDEILRSFFNLRQKENEHLKFFHYFLIYRLLEAVYRQSQQPDLFEERLLHKIFADHLKALNPLQYGNGGLLLLLPILSLLPAGLPFNRPGLLTEQIKYLFDLKPVQQFLKVHSFQDVLYFNKEHFEILLLWLFILHVLTICKNPINDCGKIKRSLKHFNRTIKEALLSGYRVETFLDSMGKKISK